MWETVSEALLKSRYTTSATLICPTGHDVTNGCQIDQAGLPLDESTLTIPDNLLFFHMLGDGIQDKLFHRLPKNGGWLAGSLPSPLSCISKDWSDTEFPLLLRHFFRFLWPVKDDRGQRNNHFCRLKWVLTTVVAVQPFCVVSFTWAFLTVKELKGMW